MTTRSPLAAQLAILIGLLVLLASVYALHASAAGAVVEGIELREGLILADTALKDQLDEETGLRGFAASGDPLFLQPYHEARDRFGPDLVALRATLDRARLSTTAVDAAIVEHTRWERDVALPTLARRDVAATAMLGKQIVDRYRADLDETQRALDTSERRSDEARHRNLDRITAFTVALVALLAAGAIVFMQRQSILERRLEVARARAEQARIRAAELRAAYDAEKRIADSLQDAIAPRPLPMHPSLRFSATYVPATEEARVGGDWYDAIELPLNRVLFAIGDVTGHGLDAAVTMNVARQALVTSALYDSEPAAVLGRVNMDLIRRSAPMVTAVAGFADARTYEFVYASAGHPPPVLLEPGRPPRLLDFGGVPLGIVTGATYTTHRVQSVPGATLVLYTDGAVEHSRNVIEGEALLLASVEHAGEIGSEEFARTIHESIFKGGPGGDDVAILTIGFGEERRASLRISADDAQSSVNSRIERPVPESSQVGLALRRAS